MQIVLFEPQIPQNAGNIVRTCSVTGASVVMISPLGFSTDSKYLKRAGLDYWDEVTISYEKDLITYLESLNHPFYFFSSHAKILYTDVFYTENDTLVFGAETHGLPPIVFERWPDRAVKIPMRSNARCLNLATSVGIGLYEAIRQTSMQF
jgi:tRNA (cytidine/uridine-2'-O-)-methyltransferase